MSRTVSHSMSEPGEYMGDLLASVFNDTGVSAHAYLPIKDGEDTVGYFLIVRHERMNPYLETWVVDKRYRFPIMNIGGCRCVGETHMPVECVWNTTWEDFTRLVERYRELGECGDESYINC